MVVIGCRPGGFSSSTDSSMSPNCASARLRGIGVAVITSMSGGASRPLPASSSRWVTPNRCCSSITARRRSWNDTSRWNTAWVPTRTCVVPAARSRRIAARSSPLSRPVSAAILTPASAASGVSAARCWRARISVGAIRTPCPPASAAISSAMNATSVLPAPTSPCSSRFIRWAAPISAAISSTARFCAPVGGQGRPARTRPRSAPSPIVARPGARRRSRRTSASVIWWASSSS